MKKKQLYLGKRIDELIYELGYGKDNWDDIGGFHGRNYVFSFCARQFEKIAGVKLKPGQCVPVKIDVKILKEKK